MNKNIRDLHVGHAVVEAHFNPIAAMENYVNDIQDRLRKKGYTKFERKHSRRSEPPIGSESSHIEPNTECSPTWWISKSDETSGFTLGTTNLSFHATDYESYFELVSELLTGLHSVHEEVSLDHVSQLGFRNLGYVIPNKSDLFTRSNQSDSGVQKLYAESKSVFKTDCGLSGQEGCLTYIVHFAESSDDLPKALFFEESFIEEELIRDEESVGLAIEMEHFVGCSISLDFTQIREVLFCLFASAESALDEVTDRELGKTEHWIKDLMPTSMFSAALSEDVNEVAVHRRSLPDVRTVPEHIENIRDTLKPKMADLSAIFDVSRQAIYKWISGETTPEDGTIDKVRQLSRISDRFREANVMRAESLLNMKTFNGLSLMELIQSGENTDEHIDALIAEARAMESAYRKSRLADSRAIPTDDWLSDISIPWSFEKDQAG